MATKDKLTTAKAQDVGAAELEIRPDRNYYIVEANGDSHIVTVVGITEDPLLGRKILCNPKVYVGNTGRRHLFFEGKFDEHIEFEVESPGGIMESCITSWNIWPRDVPGTF